MIELLLAFDDGRMRDADIEISAQKLSKPRRDCLPAWPTVSAPKYFAPGGDIARLGEAHTRKNKECYSRHIGLSALVPSSAYSPSRQRCRLNRVMSVMIMLLAGCAI